MAIPAMRNACTSNTIQLKFLLKIYWKCSGKRMTQQHLTGRAMMLAPNTAVWFFIT